MAVAVEVLRDYVVEIEGKASGFAFFRILS